MLGQSTTRSQGSFSASVGNNGWTEVVSKPVSSLGPVGPMINYDIRLPQTVTWGETRSDRPPAVEVLLLAGAGQHAAHRHARGGLPADHVRDPAGAHGGDEQHLQRSRIPVVINAPVFANSPYLLDNMTLAPATPKQYEKWNEAQAT